VFVRIEGGWFTMGSDHGQDDERPPHRVFVDTFEMGVYPVTRAEYEVFVRGTHHPPPRDWTHPSFARPDLPVVGVSWEDGVAFCAWLASRDVRRVRLPSEAEWEYAARGNRDGRYPWGDEIPDWIPDGGRGPLDGPWPVMLGQPNGFGLFGIAGNVHEWCADWHSADYYAHSPERNPTGPATGVRRVSRGGAWRHATTLSRITQRSKLDPTFRYTDYGFRVARDA
jgi:formylglycine-generating enzyme required for sulfatase activity